jgi:hypothetical protein
MKKLILILLFCSVATLSYAEKCYVFIDKIGVVHKGEEAGCTEYGDVVGISPFTPQYKPTRAELSRYKIMVIDLTENERNVLVEEETRVIGKDSEGQDIVETIRARKRKIDIDQLSHVKQEEEVSKNEILQEVIVKPPFSISSS